MSDELTPQEAIHELEIMNAQFVHGEGPFTPIIAALKPAAMRSCNKLGCAEVACRMGPDGNYCAKHLPKFGQPL